MGYQIYAGGFNRSLFGGILNCALSDDGRLSGLTAVNGVENPSFLSFSPDGGLLFSVGQSGDQAQLACFERSGDDVRLLNSQSFRALSNCQVHCWARAGLVGCACYGSGDVFLFSFDAHGLGGEAFHANYTRDGRESHPHCLSSPPDGRHLYLADLGLDRVLSYTCDNGRVEEGGELPLAPHDGPRQLLFSGDDRAYLITEYSNVVYALRRDPGTGTLSVTDRKSTLPAGFPGENYGASLAFDARSGLLYASNRGANTIAVFRASGDALAAVGAASCGGDWPRHIALTRDGRFLLCANERSDRLCVLPIGPDGMPGEPVEQITLKGASFASEADFCPGHTE